MYMYMYMLLFESFTYLLSQAKKKTLASLDDGDFYHDKLKRNKQPHR